MVVKKGGEERMKIVKIVLLSLVVLGLVFTFAFAAGEAEKGKALFNDAKFAGGVKSCNSCHPNGKGLEKSADKKEFNIMGGKQKSLEEAVNTCIVNANKGKAIDVKSAQMKELVAYIKTLKAKKPAAGY
jgi:cytochrome c